MKISFCLIAYNEATTLAANLAHLYPHAHEIIICEGSVALLRQLLGVGPRSTDGTLDLLVSFPDPARKLRVLQRDWHDKDEMAAAYAEIAAGDLLWHVDADEFYDRRTFAAVPAEFADPDLLALEIPMYTFWRGPDRVLADERGNVLWSAPPRVLRRTPGMSVSHVPIRRIVNGMPVERGQRRPRDHAIRCWHYAWCEDARVRAKIRLYQQRDARFMRPNWLAEVWDRWPAIAAGLSNSAAATSAALANSAAIANHADEHTLREVFPDGVHAARWLRLWPVPYRGPHPAVVAEILPRLRVTPSSLPARPLPEHQPA